MTYLFVLLILSFVEQMFLVLMKFSLSVFSFMDCAFGVVSEKASLCPHHLGFFLCYLLGVFIVCTLHLGLWCNWVHSCDGCKICVYIRLLLVKGCPVVPAPFVEETVLAVLCCFAPLSKTSWLTVFTGVCSWALCFVPLICLSVLSLNHSVFITVGNHSSSCVLLQWSGAHSGSLASSPCDLQNLLVDTHEITYWDFDWECVESTDKVGKN